jgi:tetratricopeptide (TPR) repeat protein
VFYQHGDYPRAQPLLAEATWTAVGSGADTVAVRAASLSASLLGAKLRRPREAKVWLDAATAALAHMGGNEELEADLSAHKAVVLAEGEWRPDLAVGIREKVIATYKRLYGPAPKTAMAIRALGVEYGYQGMHARARPYFEEALAMLESVAGETHNDTAKARYSLGQCLVATGEVPRGEAMLEEALEVFDRGQVAYWGAMTLQALTRTALIEGDTEKALLRARRALELMDRQANVPVLVPFVAVSAGEALVAGGKPDEALKLCDRALAIQEESGQMGPDKAYGWDALRCRAEALLATGDAADAVAPLERSLTLEKRVYPGDLARTRFALARALAATGGSPARAMELAEAARQELEEYPHLRVYSEQVEDWLTKNGQ